jgi:flagellar biosynthesis GTPase FlhF
MNSIKMHFCRKYYGENDYAKITPDMISLKFISTKYPTYEELLSNEKDFNYYNAVYRNEIIWVDGLVLNNATIDPTNKHLLFSNLQNNIKQKLNIVGITYTVNHNENNDFSENNEDVVEDDGQEEEEEEEKEEEKEEEEKEEEKEEKDEKKDENEEKNAENVENFKSENQSVKIYIYGNKNDVMCNKYYSEDPIGYFEFRMFNSDLNGQDYIFEHDIRVTVEDYEDFIKSK